jgi:hypothetical protein
MFDNFRSSSARAASTQGKHAGAYTAQNGSSPNGPVGIVAYSDRSDRSRSKRSRAGLTNGMSHATSKMDCWAWLSAVCSPTRLPRSRQASGITRMPGSHSDACGLLLMTMSSRVTVASASATRSRIRRPPTVCRPFGAPPKRLLGPPAVIAPIRRAALVPALPRPSLR